MTRKLFSLLFVFLTPCAALASPYFRGPWDWARGTASPQVVEGACIDPIGGAASTQCGALGLVTHSPQDGYFLVPGEDWYLLGVGYSLLGTSKIAPTLSTGFNVLPILSWAGSAAGLPVTIPSISAKGVKLDGSLSPAFVYDPSVPHGGKGYFRLLVGGTLHFGGSAQ